MPSNVFEPNLCKPCLEVFQKILEHPPWPITHVTPYTHFPLAWPKLDRTQPPDNPAMLVNFHNIQNLLQSASNGCHLCILIATEISPDDMAKLLDALGSKPDIAGDQMRMLIWRMDSKLVVRLQDPAPTDAMFENFYLNLEYMETSLSGLYRRF